MLRNLAISTLLLAGVFSAAHADVYRWVDEHGGVHYSDQWVPGSEVIKSKTSRPAPSADSTARHSPEVQKPLSSDSASNQPADQNAQKAVKQDLAKAREQQCKDAKDRYQKAIDARRIFKASDSKAKDSGDRQYLSDEEVEAYRVQARKDMDEVCGSASK